MMNLKKTNHQFIKLFLLFILLISIQWAGKSYLLEGGDTLTFRFLPYSILNEFNFDLDEFHEYFLEVYPFINYINKSGESIPYYLIKVNEHYFSTFGIGPAIVSLPFVFFSKIFFNISPEAQVNILLSKFIASSLIALSAIFIFLSVKVLYSERKAFLITFIYAFCSGMWSITSQQLGQQTASEFFLAMTIYFLVKGLRNSKFVPFAGFSMASAILMRPTNMLTMLIISIYVIHQHRHKFMQYLLWATPLILFIFGYNFFNHGSMFLFSQTIYNPMGAMYKVGSTNMWSTPLFTGFLGTLVSPSRGLLIYSPVFIFSFLGMILVWMQKQRIILKYFSAVVVGLIIIASKWYDWWGGWTFGCRVLNDCVPFLAILLIPAIDYMRSKKVLIGAFILTIFISFSVQVVGVFLFDNGWNKTPNIDHAQKRLWSWRDSQLAHYIVHKKN